jgi:hypothetical protein
MDMCERCGQRPKLSAQYCKKCVRVMGWHPRRARKPLSSRVPGLRFIRADRRGAKRGGGR